VRGSLSARAISRSLSERSHNQIPPKGERTHLGGGTIAGARESKLLDRNVGRGARVREALSAITLADNYAP